VVTHFVDPTVIRSINTRFEL